jgi:LTXXQ motif family protein
MCAEQVALAASRPALDELRAASGCPRDLPSTPTGRVAAMESRLEVMLAVRPALERFYQSLSDEQKARFNAIAPTDDRDSAAKDRRDLTNFRLGCVGDHRFFGICFTAGWSDTPCVTTPP